MMSDVDIVPEIRHPVSPEAAGLHNSSIRGDKGSAFAADIATLGTGSLLAAVLNAILVFVIPKVLNVEDYGYWRMFGLYGGYVGFLHFGFADGALLRWAGKPLSEFNHELSTALKVLFWQQIIVVGPVCAIAVVALHGPLRSVAVAVAIYALLYNEVTLLQFGLQSAKLFRSVALSTVLAPIVFVMLILGSRLKMQNSYLQMIAFYAIGWFVALIFLLACVKTRTHGPKEHVMMLLKECVSSGWPIVLANTGVVLIMFADRLAVSWAVTIQNFAQYSLAASAMAVPITAIQACSKVFFPHLAGVTPDRRKRVYGVSLRALLAASTIILPYYFVLDVFIRRFLPKYIQSLEYARVLLLSIPFIAAVQILQMSYAYLNGFQKRFLAQTLIALMACLGIISFTAFHARSLTMVATVQVGLLATWWFVNECLLKRLTGETVGNSVRFLIIYVIASSAYWFVTAWRRFEVISVLIYMVGVIGLVSTFFREDLRLWRAAV